MRGTSVGQGWDSDNRDRQANEKGQQIDSAGLSKSIEVY